LVPAAAPEVGGKKTFARRDSALRVEMTRTGDDFLQTVIRATPTGEKRTSVRIALVYGANRTADEVYHAWHEDGLYELPTSWLYPLHRWGNSSVNPYGNTADLSRQTTPRCVECHNTWFEHVPGSRSQYKRDNFILGVTCERCHGPGRDHVAFHRAHPGDDSAHAIVHPGHLTRERLLEVCTQCHGNAIHHRGPAFSYRPGEPLAAYFGTAAGKYPEDDHVANQVKYLRQSKCFQKRPEMTCITCHNPHKPHEPAGSSSAQRACLKCHKPGDCGDRPRLPAAVRDNCVGCHMPQRVWMNVHFHTADDEYVPPIRRYQHRIAVHATARQEVLLDWYRTQSDADSRREAKRLAEGLVKYWLAEADQCRRDHRFMAAIGAVREAMRVDPTPATRAKLREAVARQAQIDAEMAAAVHMIDQNRLAEAIPALHKVLAIKPDLALAHLKLGTLYANAGQNELAVKHLRAVATNDPEDARGYLKLGLLALLQGKAEEALEAFRRAGAIEPYRAEISYHEGVALARLDRLPEAIARFRQVLKIDPKHAGGCQGLSDALRRQGQTAEAVRFARRAARLTRFQNPDILLTLAYAYADSGRFTEADDTAGQALEAARTNEPRLVEQIRERVEEIQSKKGAEIRVPPLVWGILAVAIGLLILRVGMQRRYRYCLRAGLNEGASGEQLPHAKGDPHP
jgi:tetratricopeptide (TPR) repeat protein